MNIRSETTVADLATQHPATIRIFQRYGIDFCCGGKRPLGEACQERGVAFDTIRQDIEAALADRPVPSVPWHLVDLAGICGHVVERYHQALREELPRLSQMMQKVLSVHGERHAELAEIAREFSAIRAELEPHMRKEEDILFPYLSRLEATVRSGGTLPAPPFGSIERPIGANVAEHEAVGARLARVRELTAGYAAPDGACNTFRGLYYGLAELERDLHEHIHIENNILFPRAQRLESDMAEKSWRMDEWSAEREATLRRVRNAPLAPVTSPLTSPAEGGTE